MYRISELASKYNLSRSTLLYYDRTGLLTPSARNEAGYRLYSESDAKRLEAICAYRRTGLSLDDIRSILDSVAAREREVLEQRLHQLGGEIQALQNQQKVLAGILKIKATKTAPFSATDKELWVSMFRSAGMDDAAMTRWHQKFEQLAPQDHHAFLLAIGISEKEALQIRKLSRNAEKAPLQMKYVYEFYQGLDRLGPGSTASTLAALERLPALPGSAKILDIGCGCGLQTLVLAERLSGQIIAVDNHQQFLDKLQQTLVQEGLTDRITPYLASMFELPFADQSFDLIWSEGAIYIMGFGEGLQNWRRLLKPAGLLAVTEVSWFTADPPAEIITYWKVNYPAMQTVEQNRKTIAASGYQLLGDFPLPASDWLEEYYQPQFAPLQKMRGKYPDQPEALAVCEEIEQEIEMYRRYGDSFGYQFFLMEKKK